MKFCAFGEMLIDVTPYGKSERNYDVVECNPGGAPANVAVALANLGQQSSFIGQVGDDYFGHFLQHTLKDKHVDTRGLLLHKQYLTTLAMVHLAENGERSFSFYRKFCADVNVRTADIDLSLIDEADIFHFGSVSMSDEPSRTTTFDLIRHAKNKGKLISFDPNLREKLWDSLDDARDMIKKGLALSDLVKVSEEELFFITGETKLDLALSLMAKQYPVQMILVTFGSEGSGVYVHGELERFPAFTVDAIDTTGAGDGFLGGFLSVFMEKGKTLKQLSTADLSQCMITANACGAFATTQKGAIGSLAHKADIEPWIRSESWIFKKD
jgi:sugar/nucleoside kinase (ribokinase family)